MDFLNSKFLTSQNGYIHPFRECGTFLYSAFSADSSDRDLDAIVVEPATKSIGDGVQHDVVLHWERSARHYVPRHEDKQKIIHQNDFVMFHFDHPVAGQPPCAIAGRSNGKVIFDSRKLQTHDAFTHYFLTPGDYTFRVHRHHHRLNVLDHRNMPVEEHGRKLKEPPIVILLDGDDVRCQHTQIVAGQTVIWAVEKGENVSIEVDLNPQPLPPKA